MVLNGLFVVGQDTRVFPLRASMSALPNSIFDALYHSNGRKCKPVDAMAGRHLTAGQGLGGVRYAVGVIVVIIRTQVNAAMGSASRR